MGVKGLSLGTRLRVLNTVRKRPVHVCDTKGTEEWGSKRSHPHPSPVPTHGSLSPKDVCRFTVSLIRRTKLEVKTKVWVELLVSGFSFDYRKTTFKRRFTFRLIWALLLGKGDNGTEVLQGAWYQGLTPSSTFWRTLRREDFVSVPSAPSSLRDGYSGVKRFTKVPSWRLHSRTTTGQLT